MASKVKMQTLLPGRVLRCVQRIALAALAGALACDDLTDVASPPHFIDGNREVGLSEAIIGATADLYYAYDSYIVFTGLFGDELFASSLDQGQLRADARDVDENSSGSSGPRDGSIYSGWWGPQQKASFSANLIQQRIVAGEFPGITTESAEYARASLYDGFAKTWIGDAWCSAAFEGKGPEYTSAEVYALAEQEFTEAIEAHDAEPAVRQAAFVGRARVRLNLDRLDEALADAQQVDPAFEFLATYSNNTIEQRNRVWWHTWGYGNLSVDYRVWADLNIDGTTTPDPRVQLRLNPHPAYDPGQPLWAPEKVPTASAPLVIASGDEAQFIIAEIRGGQEAVDIINQVRLRNGVNATWAPSGSGPDEIRDKIIDERARTLFLEGVRLGDLRRYSRKYGLDFWPAVTPQGVTARDNTCYPLPRNERENNPGLRN